jgi:hypothetical protein
MNNAVVQLRYVVHRMAPRPLLCDTPGGCVLVAVESVRVAPVGNEGGQVGTLRRPPDVGACSGFEWNL